MTGRSTRVVIGVCAIVLASYVSIPFGLWDVLFVVGVAAIASAIAMEPELYPPRHRPTISLWIMLVLTALWCLMNALFGQGDEPGEPWDKGMVAGELAQCILISAILVFLWWKRVRGYVIVITPILILWLPPGHGEPYSYDNDTSTFIDGMRAVLGWWTPRAVIIGAALFVEHRHRRTSSTSL